MEPISDIQQKMYEFIVHTLKAEGIPPTIREIGHALGISSTGHITHHLSMLEKKGWIIRGHGKSRSIKLLSTPQGIPITGAIAAGLPLDIYPDPHQFLELGRVFALGDQVYALLVRGNSMIEDCICDGDYVVIQPDVNYQDGDIIVATNLQRGEHGSATLKRLFLEPGGVRLQPANSEMSPILIPKGEWKREWEIQGKVIAIIRAYAL